VCEMMYLEKPLKIADFLRFRYPDSLFYYNKTINKGLLFVVAIRSQREILKLKYRK
jgi:hypothetical protein